MLGPAGYSRRARDCGPTPDYIRVAAQPIRSLSEGLDPPEDSRSGSRRVPIALVLGSVRVPTTSLVVTHPAHLQA
jgi:hypothetical protein